MSAKLKLVTAKEKLGEQAFALHAQIEKLKDRLAAKKAEILAAVGEGNSFALADGRTIQITRTTQDRPNGKIDLVLDPARYAQLPVSVRAEVERLRAVTLEPGRTKGVAAQVRLLP
jgi:hypothetical protein